MRNQGMNLLSLALVNFACSDAVTTQKPDFRSGPGTEGKQCGKLKAGDALAPNDKSDERRNMQFAEGKLEGITKFENVPADEERLIKDMKVILQEK